MKYFSKKRGISSTIVTIVIISASIVLATGVVLYAASLFQGGALLESISVTNPRIWVHYPITVNLSWGAFSVRNNGDTLLSIDRIVVRGTDVPFTQWYADTDVTIDLIQQPMNFTGWAYTNGKLENDTNANCSPSTAMQLVLQPSASLASDGWFCGTTTAGPIGLDPGQATIIYYQINNGTISAVDGGQTIRLSVFAGKTGFTQSVFVESKS